VTPDFVDAILAQWAAQLPGEDFEALGVFSRLTRYGRLAGKVIYGNLEQFGLNETQFNMLAALVRSGPPYRLTPKELSVTMLVTSGAVTYVIDQMETAGNVVRLEHAQDRRSSPIELTPAGKQKIEDAAKSHQAVCEQLLAPLTGQQFGDLVATLRVLLVSVDDGSVPVSHKQAEV
jgi:DNA-binding MarR family transcriptional regulator